MSFFGQMIEVRVCSNCHSDKTRMRKNGKWPHWYKDGKGGHLCNRCYNNLVTNPKWHKINNPKWNKITKTRTFTFKTKRILADHAVRIGVCNWCRAVTGEINAQNGKPCKHTELHHEQYDDAHPDKHTIELCPYCHGHEAPIGNTERTETRPVICIKCGVTLGETNWQKRRKKHGHHMCIACVNAYQREWYAKNKQKA